MVNYFVKQKATLIRSSRQTRVLQHQQNLSAWCIAFVLLRAVSNDIADLEPLVPQLVARLADVAPGTLTIIG
jgi:hypothetical protein